MKKIDITDKVDFISNDEEYLPLLKCICGKEFGAWDFVLGVEEIDPKTCPECKRKLIFSNKITVYELKED